MLALRKSARSVVAWVREPSTRSVAPKGRTVATKRFGVASKRLYGGAAHDHHDDHHHHAPPPKIHITKFYQPIPSTTNKTEVQAAQEIKNVEGWLFGNKVAYVDPYKPLPEKETPGTNVKCKQPGAELYLEGWEALVFLCIIVVCAITMFASFTRPDFTVTIWAREELIERQIIRKREEIRKAAAAAAVTASE